MGLARCAPAGSGMMFASRRGVGMCATSEIAPAEAITPRRPVHDLIRSWATLAIALVLVQPAVAQSTQPPTANQRCLNCHGQPLIAELPPEERLTMVAVAPDAVPSANAPAARPALFVHPAPLKNSVHADVACVTCHADTEQLPHPLQTAPADCGSCHEQQQVEYAQSVHGRAVAENHSPAARCWDCHGAHDILSRHNTQSRTYKLHLPGTCAACHANPRMMEQEHVHRPHAAEQYIDSMHGRALLVDGLIVAPSCNDCHGVHDIRPPTDPRSTIHRDTIPQTCGKCHIGVADTYRKSIHGQLVEAGDERAPVCATCHTAHEVVTPGDTAFKLLSDDRCGQCHQDRLRRYRETFHGKAIALGLAGVAACYDCHGHHDIVPISNPASPLSSQRKLQTCRRCHPDASQPFTEYLAHADHTNANDYPILYWTFVSMTLIVLSTFAFFGVHTALWFVRSGVLFARNPAAFREAKTKAARDEQQFVRFSPFERFLHGLMVVSFLLLVATGMPLKFYDSGWAQWMLGYMGGLEVAGALHRLGAIITFVYFGLHLVSLARGVWARRGDFRHPETGRFSVRQVLGVAFGPDMPLVHLQDVRDWWAHQKWFFGLGPRPQFDRWTYWEKFDYFAVFWGVAIIGVSGLVMWFPEASTRFLPGWIINVALVIHSDEALLAAGFIFTFHFFNVHFRLEKFPMDPVIFSGRVSQTEMLHERKRWYDRLLAAGKLDQIRVRDEWSQWKRVMHPLGFAAFVTGVVLLLLIFYAMGARLFGLGH